MSFSEILKDTVEGVDGAFSAMVIGTDGMPVEGYTVQDILNLDEFGAEISQLIMDITVAAENLGLGEAREFSIVSDLCGIIIRRINSEYYLALLITPDGNFGKGRFVLRVAIPRIEEEF